VTGYEAQLSIFEEDSGITFLGAEMISGAHPALFPGQVPTVLMTGEALAVTTFAPAGTVPLSNGRGLFRAHYSVAPATVGVFHVVFDTVFTNISNASAQPIVLGGLIGGSISVGQQPVTLPQVVEVLVADESDPGWSAEFLEALFDLGFGDSGYSIPVGSNAQLLPLSWDSITTVKVRFSEDVIVDQDDLVITGVNVAEYDIAGFSYDATTFTASWQLLGPVGPDKLLLDLNADGDDPVRNAGGVALDGEWETGFSVYPSGDGLPGGDFQFRLNVLPGDVDADGRTRIFDTIQTRDKQFTEAGDANYSVFHDIDGNGMINIFDTVAVSNNQFRELPAGEPEPLPPPEGAGFTAQALAVAKSAESISADDSVARIMAEALAMDDCGSSDSSKHVALSGAPVEYVDTVIATRESEDLVTLEDESSSDDGAGEESHVDLLDEALMAELGGDLAA
jgi:hypothetical protein